MSYTNVRLLLVSALVIFSTLVGCKKDPEKTISSEKKISLLSVKDANGNEVSYSTNETKDKLEIAVPSGTDIKGLAISCKSSERVTISPDPATIKDYSKPVEFVVTSEDGSEQTYSITVARTGNSITKFTFNVAGKSINGVIDETTKTIKARLPLGTPLKGLKPEIEVSEGATVARVEKGDDFTYSVKYVVTSEDNHSSSYIVIVVVSIVADEADNFIREFSFTAADNGFKYDINGLISESAIWVEFPFGTPLTGLKPKIEISDKASITSDIATEGDFSKPVKYTVTAENNDKKVYTLNVKVTPASTDNRIYKFYFLLNSKSGYGVINDTDNTIVVSLPSGSKLTGLKPVIGLSNPGATITSDATTEGDFTKPVKYAVTAQNNDIRVYTVTVTIAPPRPDNSITRFAFWVDGRTVKGVIDETAKTIVVMLPFGTPLTGLMPTIEISEGATVSPDIGTRVDFTKPVFYTVTAENSNQKVYTVTVTVAKTVAKTGNKITKFTFYVDGNSIDAVIDEKTHNIVAKLPFGTPLTGLKYSIEVSQGATVETSDNVAEGDFRLRIIKYLVTAENEDVTTYLLEVTTSQ